KIDYFDKAFHSLINFEFKWNALQQDNETIFNEYSKTLHGNLNTYGLLNYLTSHDDGQPYDPRREKPYETATKLLLAPGTSQIYYGDESARSLIIEGTVGDATLRSFMNWDDIKSSEATQTILRHWQKLGQFRKNHPAVGAGTHQMISESPYIFYRSYSKDNYKDVVVVGLDLPIGSKTLDVSKIFKDDDLLMDSYSGQEVKVVDGKAMIDSPYDIVLLELNN